MKKWHIALAVALLAAGTSVASAQDQPPRMGGQARGNMMGMLLQGITLSAEQQVKVDSINAKYMEKRRAMRDDQTMDRETMRAKGRELMEQQTGEVKAVLTAEQKVVFEKNVKEMEERRSQMPPGGQRPPV